MSHLDNDIPPTHRKTEWKRAPTATTGHSFGHQRVYATGRQEEEDGGNPLCVTNVTRPLLACFVVNFTNINVSSFLQKDLFKKFESEFWRKVISNKIIVTFVTQGLPSSFLSRPVA